MRILLANHHLARLGGTEVWTRTMFEELSKEHQVDTFWVVGHNRWSDMSPLDPNAKYDVALVNHGPAMRALRSVNINRVVMTMHGVIPALEWPVLGADAYVSVAEEVRHFVPVRSEVIGNPIQVDRFRPLSTPARVPKRIAMLTNHISPAIRLVLEACELMGAQLRFAGIDGGSGSTDAPEELMNWADVVVGVGRTALEGMACARNVYCIGQTGAAGMITNDTVDSFAPWNFYAPVAGLWPTASDIADEISTMYDPARDLRPYVVERHASDRVAAKYLELADCVPRSRRLLARAVRGAPGPWMTRRVMTLVDPVLRELQGRAAADGRPGVLEAYRGPGMTR